MYMLAGSLVVAVMVLAPNLVSSRLHATSIYTSTRAALDKLQLDTQTGSGFSATGQDSDPRCETEATRATLHLCLLNLAFNS